MLLRSVAFVGPEAERFVLGINADVFFFSSRGYTKDGFITDSSPEEASLRRAMLGPSEKSVYLADTTKQDQKYMYNICRLHDIVAHIDEL